MAVVAGEKIAKRRVVQIDAEIVRHHELDPAHHIVRAGRLAEIDETPAARDRAPVDPAGIEARAPGSQPERTWRRSRWIARSALAGALADQIGRQIPIGIEGGVADQPGHKRVGIARLPTTTRIESRMRPFSTIQSRAEAVSTRT